MNHIKGFTLVELMVVLTIMAVLATVAAPSFQQTILSTRMSGAVNTFLADARFARSQAMKKGGNVLMCRSANAEASSPTCSTTDPNIIGWASGWIIFHDRDGSGQRNSGDEMLRVQAAIPSVVSIVEQASSPKYKFTFTETGRLKNLSGGVATLQFGSNPPFTNALQRMVCVSVGGRARVAGDGTTDCS